MNTCYLKGAGYLFLAEALLFVIVVALILSWVNAAGSALADGGGETVITRKPEIMS